MVGDDDLVIVGASGHAKVIIELFRSCGGYTIRGIVDPRVSGDVLGVPVLGDDDVLLDWRSRGLTNVFIAIGDNGLRRRLTLKARAAGFRMPAVISPRASVSPTVALGDGVAVMDGATINASTVIGPGAIINTNASVDHDCAIGPFVHCAPGTHLAGNVRLDEGVFFGIGAVAIPRVHVGEWSVVGAGAVVANDLCAGVTAVGVPARKRVGDKQ